MGRTFGRDICVSRRRWVAACSGYAATALVTASLPQRARAAQALPPPGRRLAFDVLRNGSKIGTHALTFDPQGDGMDVHIDCRMAVGIGPLILFRYRHRGVERWRNGVFTSLETETDNDGTDLRVRASRDSAGIHIEATGQPPRILQAASLPLTHWNISCMSAPLFNPQDGKPVEASVTARAPGEVTLASGQLLPATRFSLTGKQMLDDWYDGTGLWAGLQARVTDGSMLDYRRV